MKLVFLAIATIILIYIGIYIVTVVPYHIYLKKNKKSLNKKGITNVDQLMKDFKERKNTK